MLYLEQDLDTLWLAGDGGQVQGGASWKEEEAKRQVGGPMQANDSQEGKARDAQIIKGRLEREALGHMGPEIPVSPVLVHAVEVEVGTVHPACREGTSEGRWPDFMRKEAGAGVGTSSRPPARPPLLP